MSVCVYVCVCVCVSREIPVPVLLKEQKKMVAWGLQRTALGLTGTDAISPAARVELVAAEPEWDTRVCPGYSRVVVR